jgi:hypothetical protein
MTLDLCVPPFRGRYPRKAMTSWQRLHPIDKENVRGKQTMKIINIQSLRLSTLDPIVRRNERTVWTFDHLGHAALE